jgi:hypothetical protein
VVQIQVIGKVSDHSPRKSDTGAGTGGLVHLTEDQSDLGLAIELDDGGLLHFVVQIVAFASTLPDSSEDRETTMGLGNVVLFFESV